MRSTTFVRTITCGNGMQLNKHISNVGKNDFVIECSERVLNCRETYIAVSLTVNLKCALNVHPVSGIISKI